MAATSAMREDGNVWLQCATTGKAGALGDRVTRRIAAGDPCEEGVSRR
jgi:hypothetical protein